MKRLLVATFAICLFSTLAGAEWVKINGPATKVTVLESGPERTLLEVLPGGFTIERVDIAGNKHAVIDMPGAAPLLETGSPSLPFLASSVIIPDRQNVELRVVEAEIFTLAAEPVVPSKGNLYRNVDPAKVPYSFGPAYQKDAFYPENLVELSAPFIIRDFRGVTVRFYPVRHNPVKGTLEVVKRLVVEIVPAKGVAANPFNRSKGSINREFLPIYQNLFVNFSAQAVRYDTLSEAGLKMLIISADAYVNNLKPLVDWKRRKGYQVKVVKISTIGNNATSIKNFILSEYNSNNISYVLLVGEANEVAPGVGTVGAASGETSDPIYSLLAGGDNYPDIFIGRFSAGSAARVDVQAAKSVKYERDPQIGGAWYGRASGLASSEGSPADSTRMNWVRDTLLYYEYDRVDKIHQPSATSAQIRDSVNAGRGLINYLGHGSTTSWSNPPFSVTNVNELTNNNLLPIVNSVACVVGDFAGTATCFCEAWQWAGTPEQPRGSVVHYGSSINQSWVPPTISQMEANRLLAQRKRVTAGGFFFNGSIRMMEYYGAGGDGDDMFQTWHIFGDASVPIRSDLPAELSVTHANIVSLGSNVPFAVQVARQSGGQPVAGALVCALSRSDSSVQAAGYTDASGNATLNITNSNPDTIWVTVTGHNLAPYLGHAMAAVPANVSIVPDHIPVNTTTAVTVTVTESEPPYNGIDSIVVTISGLGVNPALVETTDASGSAGFSVHPLYGELLSVTGRRIGEGFDMFRDTIWVTGGANYDLVDLLVGVPEIALYDTVAPNFGGLFEGHLEPPGYTMFITGCGIDTSATTAGEYLPIIATPTSSGSIIGAIAKAGYNVYIKNIICKQVYGTLSGTVTDDATALPLAGVRVVGLAGADTAFDVQTNASGLYATGDSIPCGSYDISLSKFGYLGQSEAYLLRYGANNRDFVLEPAPSGTISGAVTEAGTGTPLDASISVYRTDDGSLYATATSSAGSGGAYSIPGLPYFNYRFEATAYQHRKAIRTVDVDSPSGTEDFALEPTQGDILVINDHDAKGGEDSKLSDEELAKLSPEEAAKRRNPKPGDFSRAGESAAQMAAMLAQLGYSVTLEQAAATNPATWGSYDVVLWSCGQDQTTVNTAAYRTNLIDHVNGGGRLLIEGGELGYDHYSANPTFAQTVLRISGWSGDNVGALTLQQPTHPLAVEPNALPASLPVAYANYGSQDAVTPAGGGIRVYGTTSYPNSGGIVVYDDSPGDPLNGQIVYFAFDFRTLSDSLTRTQVLENSVEYLLRPSAPPAASISGTVTLSGQGSHEGVVVSATLGSQTWSDTSDASGAYQIGPVYDGTYTVRASKFGYTDSARQVAVSGATSGVDFTLYPMNVVYQSDLEADNGGWTGTGDWAWGVPTSGPGAAHSGTKLWATNLAGNYSNNSNSTLTLGALRALPEGAKLEFWHWHSFEGTTTLYDGGNVKVSTNGGGNWTVITPVDGYSGTAYSSTPGVGGQQIFGGSSGGWAKKEFDLSAYNGQSAMFRLHFGSDGYVNSYPGWYVDDIKVYAPMIGVCGDPQASPGIPTTFSLGAARPNPTRERTEIRFGLPKETRVELGVYNIVGQKVATLASGVRPAGYHTVRWDGRSDAGQKVSGGVYFYRLTTPDYTGTKRLVMLR